MLAFRTSAMPLIKPLQLLNYLGSMLSPAGGILSRDEVKILAEVMTKFSEKLSNKCIYVMILKNTEMPVLREFMVNGGWNLMQVWLQEGFNNKNWAFIVEILELLLISPVDGELLKMNNLLKLVQCLSTRDDHQKIGKLAKLLATNWLRIWEDHQIKKMDQGINIKQQNQKLLSVAVFETIQVVKVPIVKVQQDNEDITPVEPVQESAAVTAVAENMKTEKEPELVPEESKEKKEVNKRREKSNHGRHKHRSSSSSSKSDSRPRSSKKKDRRNRDKSRNSSSHERSKDKSKHDKDKHKYYGDLKSSSKSNSSSSKDKHSNKETKKKQAEKDKGILARLQQPSLSKIGRIPKKSSEGRKDEKKDEVKKPTFSIEVRKNSEEKPKTVFNAIMRPTSLLKEAKSPPPRTVKKQRLVNSPPVLPWKRSTPIGDLINSPEKKRETETTERPGAMELILPNPKHDGITSRMT